MFPALISIILPFFNAEKTLERALKSIQCQTLSEFECILVDNNSTDGSRYIAGKIIKTDARFSLIEETKQGVAHAFNTGHQIANGQFIARMDADDECMPKRLELQYKFLINNQDFEAVAGNVEYIAHQSKTKGFANYVDWINSLKSMQDIYLNRFVELPIVNPSCMWRKDCGLKYGIYRDGDFPEDYEMWLRWMSMEVKIGKINDSILKWYDSEYRLTRTHTSYTNEVFYKIKSKYLALELQKTNPNFPKVAIWGASKTSRHRAQLLLAHGIEIEYYIDITNKRQIEEEIVHYSNIPSAGKDFILVYIRQKTLKTSISKFLKSKGYQEGIHFLFAS